MTPLEVKTDFIRTLDHVQAMVLKLRNQTGLGRAFSFPDQHKFAEGMFLTCWTHWEEFTRELLVTDVAINPNSFVRVDVRNFRVLGAPRRLAEAVLFHPDHPEKFVEWDFTAVRKRADAFLPPGHRFTAPLPRQADLELLKRMRNAIAHKSDRAWESFTNLARHAPFSLIPSQMRGITVGRFIAAHTWNNNDILEESIIILRGYANALVP